MKGTVNRITATAGGILVFIDRDDPPPPEEVEIPNPPDWAYDLFKTALAGGNDVNVVQDEADNVMAVTVNKKP